MNVSGSIDHVKSRHRRAQTALLNSERLQPGELRCIEFAVLSRNTVFECKLQMLSSRFDVAEFEIGQREPEVKLGLIVGASDFLLEELPRQHKVFLLHRRLAEVKVMKRSDGFDLRKPAL